MWIPQLRHEYAMLSIHGPTTLSQDSNSRTSGRTTPTLALSQSHRAKLQRRRASPCLGMSTLALRENLTCFRVSWYWTAMKRRRTKAHPPPLGLLLTAEHYRGVDDNTTESSCLISFSRLFFYMTYLVLDDSPPRYRRGTLIK
mmetsp:Transcript_21274/g.44416  ORF Transcript_21274/g.44416 Transcript_21274/m.44416 type:complete len:143 (+) Transcript_21274:902-1330(+)